MIECLCKYGRINEYKKLFLKAWDVPKGELFSPIQRDCDIMDEYVTGKESSWSKTLETLQQRLFIMSTKTIYILHRELTLLRLAYGSMSNEERDPIQKKKRRIRK